MNKRRQPHTTVNTQNGENENKTDQLHELREEFETQLQEFRSETMKSVQGISDQLEDVRLLVATTTTTTTTPQKQFSSSKNKILKEKTLPAIEEEFNHRNNNGEFIEPLLCSNERFRKELADQKHRFRKKLAKERHSGFFFFLLLAIWVFVVVLC